MFRAPLDDLDPAGPQKQHMTRESRVTDDHVAAAGKNEDVFADVTYGSYNFVRFIRDSKYAGLAAEA